MLCLGCISELYHGIVAYIHKVEAQQILLCGCAGKLLDKFKKDDKRLINIDPVDLEPFFCEAHRQRQSDIAHPDNPDPGFPF